MQAFSPKFWNGDDTHLGIGKAQAFPKIWLKDYISGQRPSLIFVVLRNSTAFGFDLLVKEALSQSSGMGMRLAKA